MSVDTMRVILMSIPFVLAITLQVIGCGSVIAFENRNSRYHLIMVIYWPISVALLFYILMKAVQETLALKFIH
jgi:hypothetical protein